MGSAAMCLMGVFPRLRCRVLAGGGDSAGQLHGGPAAGAERALLLLLVALAAAELAAQLADRAGEAAQLGEAAAGAGLPAEAAGGSRRGEEEEGARVGAEGAAAEREGGPAAPPGNAASSSRPCAVGRAGGERGEGGWMLKDRCKKKRFSKNWFVFTFSLQKIIKMLKLFFSSW